MAYQVKDGVISQNYQDYIEEIFTNDFPWYYQSQLAGDDDNTSSFIHMSIVLEQIFMMIFSCI